MARVAVIGTGYVGLTTGVCLAHLGHDVVCADVDREKIARLSRGVAGIVEDRLPELLAEGLENGRLNFVVGAANAVFNAEIVFLCLPTPQCPDGSADLSFVSSVCEEISSELPSNCVVVNKSTVPVGSGRTVMLTLGRDDVFVVSNPEFLREGSAVNDFLCPDRVVIGSEDEVAARRVAALYASLDCQVVMTDRPSAEMIKYASNAFLATKLGFVNEIANICEGTGADIDDVVIGMGLDRRIGNAFMRPGPGWGGSCFPKDSRALVQTASSLGYDFKILKCVIAANEVQFDRLVTKVVAAGGGSLQDVQIAVWGLTFKAGTDDLRESPAISVLSRLVAAGADAVAFDPTVETLPPSLPPSVRIVNDPIDATHEAEVLVVLTEWDDFSRLDPSLVAKAMAGRSVVDGRNILDSARWRSAGFDLQRVGLK